MDFYQQYLGITLGIAPAAYVPSPQSSQSIINFDTVISEVRFFPSFDVLCMVSSPLRNSAKMT